MYLDSIWEMSVITPLSFKADRVIYRLKRREFHRFFGRFSWIRSLHREYRVRQSAQYHDYHIGSCNQTVICSSSVDDLVQSLRDDGIANGLKLPPSLVEEIMRYASRSWSKIDAPKKSRSRINIPNSLENWAIREISEDPLLKKVASCYLGYQPRLQKALLYWSQPSLVNIEKTGVIPPELHWDIWGYNVVSVFFYLTDACRESGAHVMVKGSHLNKPKRMIFGSCSQSDSLVLKYFEPHNIQIIEGPSGSGFIEDPFCLHGNFGPIKHKRLMLQLRYF